MDTPETKDPNRPVECYGPEASDQIEKLVENKKVCLA
ncbi:MAG: thermonuclease family protein [Candidatus Peribacteria bacterium]|nr:thermonuclease family protein [Candidatus Peribacteria bacterium]